MLTILRKKTLVLYVGNWLIKLLANRQPGMKVVQNRNYRLSKQIKIKKDVNRGKNQRSRG